MGGMATRMMTFLRLNMLDETPHPHPKPFLSVETLRRLAWAVWYLDATMDGGNFGFATIAEGAMTIQLPCDERSFFLHQPVTTQPLVPSPLDLGQPANLGLAAHVIRAMYARQILADVHSRLQRRLVPPTAIAEFVLQAVARSTAVLESLPPDLSYNRSLYYAYKDQQSLLLHLHVMRNTARRHVALLRILAADHLVDGLADIAQQRRDLIGEATALSNLMADAIDHQVVMDPQMAMHAYNGIEGGCLSCTSAQPSVAVPAASPTNGAARRDHRKGPSRRASETAAQCSSNTRAEEQASQFDREWAMRRV